MLKVEDLLKKIEGKSPEEQAKLIANYYSDKKRKATVEESRKATRDKIFVGLKKLTKAQQEALIYEYLSKNTSYIRNWFYTNHAELKVQE